MHGERQREMWERNERCRYGELGEKVRPGRAWGDVVKIVVKMKAVTYI